jgi:hypothetical protein
MYEVERLFGIGRGLEIQALLDRLTGGGCRPGCTGPLCSFLFGEVGSPILPVPRAVVA